MCGRSGKVRRGGGAMGGFVYRRKMDGRMCGRNGKMSEGNGRISIDRGMGGCVRV